MTSNDPQGSPQPARPFPNSDYIRPGIDDRPDLDEALTPEEKDAVARLAVTQKPRPARSAATRPEVQSVVMESGTAVGGSDEPIPDVESAFLDMRDPMVDAEGYQPTRTEINRMRIGFMLAATLIAFALSALNIVLIPSRLNEIGGAIGGAVGLAWVIGVGNMIALIATIVFLPMSDHTRTPLGRRTPWFVGGTLIAMMFTFVLEACHTTVSLAVIWSLVQIGIAAMLCAMYASIGERVPDKFRESINFWRTVGILIGLVLGISFGALMTQSTVMGLSICAIALLFAGILGLLIVPRERSSTYMRVRPMNDDDLLVAVRVPHATARWYLICAMRAVATLGMGLTITFVWFLVTYQNGPMTAVPERQAMITLLLMAVLACGFGLLATWVLNLLRERWDRNELVLIAISILAVIAVLIPVMLPTPAGLLLFAALGGFAVHMIDDIMQTIAVSSIPRVDHAANYLAVFNTSGSVGRICGVIIGGIVIGATGSFFNIFIAGALAFTLTTLLVVIVAITTKRETA